MHWVKTAPATEPVTLAEAKAHLNVTDSVDDALITSLIPVARRWVENYLNRALITQTWIYARDDWPKGDEMALPGGKMLSLVGVTYRDTAGTVVPFADVLADTDGSPRVVLAYNKVWPSTTLYPLNPIQVEYTCGYGNAVLDNIKHAMKLLIGHWYEHREAVVTGTISKQIEFAVDSLIYPERVFWHASP
jgi:uncharacterized phiE125 gp8 family phage protein